MDSKIGLVLSGGGGKGAFEIGAWKALKRLGIDKKIQVISGNSIGSLNAVMFMAGELEMSLKMWRSLIQKEALPLSSAQLLVLYKKYKKGIVNILEEDTIVDSSGYEEIIGSYVNFDKVRSSKIKGYISAYNMDDDVVEYFTVNDKKDEEIERLIKASSALPGLFDPIKINDKFYRDGCIKDNVPIDPLYKEGCDEIIIIYLGENEKVDLSKYEGVKFYEIIPRANLGGMLDGNLDFSGSGANKRILQGYLDTMKYFDKLAYEEGVPLNELDIVGEIE